MRKDASLPASLRHSQVSSGRDRPRGPPGQLQPCGAPTCPDSDMIVKYSKTNRCRCILYQGQYTMLLRVKATEAVGICWECFSRRPAGKH
ncbi:hypothetical protein BX600DRAFT_455209 [Xylariales sp. PMI_506]|nr:hypothetical protein BX600DRAFT_455209 [Xylariales sp. PMI_506]